MVRVDETFRHPRVLRLLQFADDRFVTEEERERHAVGLRQQSRQRDHRADVLRVLERGLERPHFLVSCVRVQRTAIRGGDYELEQVRAAVAVYIFQTIAQGLVRLEIIEQARVGIDLLYSKPKKTAPHDDRQRTERIT